jgi:hypothetical protein
VVENVWPYLLPPDFVRSYIGKDSSDDDEDVDNDDDNANDEDVDYDDDNANDEDVDGEREDDGEN